MRKSAALNIGRLARSLCGILARRDMCEIMKPKVYFLPGFACTADIWRPCATGLADHYDTTALFWPTDLTPNFDTISHFSNWFRSRIALTSTDTLVGHSLGGLVALDIARESGLTTLRVVLVESFITPPQRFFQNLLMPTASATLLAEVTNMLARERPRYSATLRERLTSVDVSAEAEQTPARIDAVYGGRGFAATEVIDSLGWTAPLRERIGVHVVSNTCHFPMLEQPVATEQTLRSILDK